MRWLLSLLLVCATSVHGQGTVETQPGASATSGAWTLLHAGDFNWRSRTDRLAVAADLRRRVATLARRIPPQSPAEQAAVQAREDRYRDDGAQARSRLFLSAEYQHGQLINTLAEIEQALDCVATSAALAAEMACWSDAAVALLKEDQLRLALDTLRQARRLPRKRNTPLIDRDPDLWYAHFGRGILNSLLAPYLRAQAQRQGAPPGPGPGPEQETSK